MARTIFVTKTYVNDKISTETSQRVVADTAIENDINKNRGRKKEEDIDYKERYEILKKYQAFLKAQRERK